MKPTFLTLAAAGLASAHTIFTSLEVGGVNSGTGQGVRVPTYNGPITDVTSNSMACNGNPNPTSPTSKVITVQAGQDVTAIWRYMLSTTGTSPNEYVCLTACLPDCPVPLPPAVCKPLLPRWLAGWLT